MEINPQRPQMLGHPANSTDAGSVSGLSAILVATIQEAKDRISQIEFIFCSKLFPYFQLTSQNWQKICIEAREATDVACKEKEIGKLFQIKSLECKGQHVLVDNQLLVEEQSSELRREREREAEQVNEGRELLNKLQNLIESKEFLMRKYENTIKELEGKSTMFLKEQKSLQSQTEELRLEVMKKSKKVDEVMELQTELLVINQSRASLIFQKEEQLKEHGEKIKDLGLKLEETEKKAEELQSALGVKTDEVDKGKEMQVTLLKKLEDQASEVMNTKQLLSRYDGDNILLVAKVQSLSDSADKLQKEMDMKINELEEERQSKKQLLQQIDAFNLERNKVRQEFEEFEKDKQTLLDRKKYLEEKVDKLQACLHERSKESSEAMELHGKLLLQIEKKNSEVLSEKRKRTDVIAAYKRLKSQYNLLHKNYNLNAGNMLSREKEDDVNAVTRHCKDTVIASSTENNASTACDITNDVTKQTDEHEKLADRNVDVFRRSSTVSPSSSSILIPQKCPTSAKSCPPKCPKVPISSWRDTRLHQSRLQSDPHDDFLDTPLEKVRDNLEKDNCDLPKLGLAGAGSRNSDDETQDMGMKALPLKEQMPSLKAGRSAFKYVEPSLKGKI